MSESPLRLSKSGVGFLSAGLLLGAVVTWLLAPAGLRGMATLLQNTLPAAEGDAHDEADDPHAHEEVAEDEVQITLTAATNIGLKVEKARLEDEFRRLRVAGDIIERPGHSNHVVTTPVTGVVVGVHAVPGEAVRAGEKLFSVRLTGEAMANAQSQLLDTLRQIATTTTELKRLAPAESAGGLAVKTRKQLEYDLTRLEGQQSTRMQELLVRGLTESQVQQIVDTGRLLRELTVTVPTPDHEGMGVLPAVSPGEPPVWDFTLEQLNVFPGKAVQPGDDLCHLAEHSELQVCGHAFPQDVKELKTAIDHDWTISLEIDDGRHEIAVNDLQVLYIDNHIDAETQTIGFYLPLDNDVLQDLHDDKGRTFRSWRFRPGQRVHVTVPVEKFQQQFVLPPDAVVEDGGEAFVFRRVKREGEHAHPGEARPHPAMDTFRKIPVQILFEDSTRKIIAADGQLQPGHAIAMNNAYKLHLAMKAAAEGGGGHHHHDH